jgi:vacuolar-type H+-ATPase subunit I/STV1
MWDTVKREYTKMVDDIASVPKEKYAKLCQDVLTRQRQAEAERVRVQSIKDGINNNVMAFSKQISECKTSQELISLERMINLEKGKSSKYQEFIGEAKERLESLTALIKQQKEIIKESVALVEKLAKAVEENDDETIVALSDKKEELTSRIEENQILVQEQAINSTLNNQLETATEVFPIVKARRTVWSFEGLNLKETMKKAPHLLVISLDEKKVKESLQILKDSGQLEGKTEFVLNGIRYFESKSF